MGKNPVQVSMNFSTKLFHAWSEMKKREKNGSPRIIFVIRTCNPRVKMKSRQFIIQCRHEIGRVCGNINDCSSQKPPPPPTMMMRIWRTRLGDEKKNLPRLTVNDNSDCMFAGVREEKEEKVQVCIVFPFCCRAAVT